MSTTDPLRDALERIVSAGTKPIDSTLSKSLQFKARGQAMLDIAAATLAAVPAEPNTTCVQGDDAKSAAEKLAVPVEPEAWEWRVLLDNYPHALDSEEQARREMERCRDVDFGKRPAPIFERRRPGTAPGEWERVDPEPRDDQRNT